MFPIQRRAECFCAPYVASAAARPPVASTLPWPLVPGVAFPEKPMADGTDPRFVGFQIHRGNSEQRLKNV